MAVKVPARPDDDLFKDTTMTFGEHLEELRVCLWRAIVGLVLGFLIGLYFGRDIVLWIQEPLHNALVTYYRNQSKEELIKNMPVDPDTGKPLLEDIAPVERLLDEGLMFETVYIQANALIDRLKENYPREFATLTLPANPTGHPVSRFGPITVLPSDVLDVPAAARELVAGSEATIGPAKRIWDLLDEGLQGQLRKAAGAQLSAAERQELAASLAAALDGLLDQELYDAETFQGVFLTPEGRALVGHTDLPKQSQRRLNRLLIEGTLPLAIAATHTDMINVLIWRPIENDPRTRITALSAQESFGIYMKASLLLGVVIASPWMFYQIWMFVAAGLYRHEKRYVHIFLPFSLGLFLAGAALVFAFVFEPVLNFLFGFNAWLGIDPDPRISEWLSFVLILPLGFGLAFQLPLVMLFLERIGIFTLSAYLQKWKIAIMAICILSVILTPSDPISMLLMFGPLSVLYFLGIALCRWMPRSRSPFDA